MHFLTHTINVTQSREGDTRIAKTHQFQLMDKDCTENFETDPFHPADAPIPPHLLWAPLCFSSFLS